MKTQAIHHQYDEIISGALVQKILTTCTQEMQPRVQPLYQERTPACDDKFRISRFRLDQDTGTLLLSIKGTGSSLQLLARSHLVTLFLRYQHQLHQSEALEVIKTQVSQDGLILRTCLPENLARVFQRSHFRVHLPETMKVETEVRHLGKTYKGELVDLSFGGCRLALPIQSSLLLGVQQKALQVKIIFPCGESFVVKTEKVTLLPNKNFSQALLGCRFEEQETTQNRRLMRFILETEREVARVSGTHRRTLLPSTLFQVKEEQSAKLEEPDYQQAAPKTKSVGPLADQVGAQALMLLGKGHFSGSELQKTAGRLVDDLHHNRDALQLKLSKSDDIHPVIHHTLRVAARFFPMAAKMGLSHHYHQALMAALLLSDMSRLIAGGRTCANLNILELIDRNAHKTALLQVIRGLGKLQWIPRSLGESLIVNTNEKIDGSGFPRGLKGQKLDSLTRGLSVVKYLDCLTQPNQEGQRLSWQQAYEQVRQQPDTYDLFKLDLFIQLNGLYPVGSCIAFEKGHRAWVTQVDNQGQPSEVELMTSAPPGEGPVAGERVTSQYARSLGKILGEVQF